MKKFLSVILSCLMVLSMVSVTSFADENVGQLEGEGTAENPFVIKTADDLIDMSNLIEQDAAYANDYYVLANDIDCTGASITPIGKTNYFSGVLDGQSFEISNIVMDDATDNTGLIAFADGATVKNIGIVDSNIKGAGNTGAIIGRSMHATVYNSYARGVTIFGGKDSGGLIGMCNNSVVENCFSNGNVTGKGESAGGLLGSLNASLDTTPEAKPVLRNCYSLVIVSATKYGGAIMGWDEGLSSPQFARTIENVYYLESKSPMGNNGESDEYTPCALKEFIDGTLLEKLNSTGNENYATWITGGSGYPEFREGTGSSVETTLKGDGTEESPYLIENADDLLEMARVVELSYLFAGANYKLTASIDMKEVDFEGIGDFSFSGTFDGGNHVVRNLNMDLGSQSNAGFFRNIDGAVIKNFGIESGSISCGFTVGSIAGNANNSQIINCYNNAEIKGFDTVGGIAGSISNTTIKNSFNKGKIRGTFRLGGIVGKISAIDEDFTEPVFDNCYNLGHVNWGTYSGKVIGFTAVPELNISNTYYNMEQIPDMGIGNVQPFITNDEVIGKTKAELTDKEFVNLLNANAKEGYLTWTYGEDKTAVFEEFEEVGKLEAFMASVTSVEVKDGKISPIYSDDGKYVTSVYGSTNKNVVDLEGNVYTPLTEQTALLILDVYNTESNEKVGRIDRNIEITIPGKYDNEGINQKPNVVPGLREWYGLEGNFEITGETRIVATSDESLEMANRLKTYFKDMLDMELSVVQLPQGEANDIILNFNTDRQNDLQEEGYEISITDRIIIEAPTEIGLFYGGVSLTQILYQEPTHSLIPKGYIRDYPEYELRGGMMDVARKYFSLDYIEEMGKYMSWFKLNTLSLHINDCGGEYPNSFVVESKKYPQLNLNNGEYVWSQDDYRQMQKNLKEYGVNVITEIDTPGHAAMFGNIDSTIVNGANFDLSGHYDESLALVEDVFDEFLDGEDPVFQSAYVHIGTDESANTNENMRRYINDLAQYLLGKDNVDKVVFWGNLTYYYGETTVNSENVVNQIWDSADQRVDEALDAGFDVINSTSNIMYLVPNTGAAFGPGTFFNGYVDMARFYDTWQGGSDFNTRNLSNPYMLRGGIDNYYGDFDVLKGNPQILGSLFCNWNDAGWYSDYDILDLMISYIGGISEKLWYGDEDRFESGEEFVEAFNAVGDFAAYANPRRIVKTDTDTIAQYDFENVTENTIEDIANDYDGTLVNGEIVFDDTIGSNVFKLDGTSYINLPFDAVGYPYTISFDLYLDGEKPENAVLFQDDHCTFYLNYKENGVSFVVDKYEYTFNTTIPTDQWVNIKLTSTFVHGGVNTTTLVINDEEFSPTVLDRDNNSKSSYIGTEKMFEGITGKIDNISIYNKYRLLYDPNFKFEGEGTEESPYLIQNAEDLSMFSNFLNSGEYTDAYFKLTNDIDMAGAKYTTVATFSGTFDGDGHVISNLTINNSGVTNVGLIGFLEGGTIKNLGIVDSTITGGDKVGAFAGRTMHATIYNCYGKNVTVSGRNDVGGLVGMCNNSVVENCFTTGTITGTGISIGGVFGSMNSSLDANPEAQMVVNNCYSTAEAKGEGNVGAIAGWDEYAAYPQYLSTIDKVYYLEGKNPIGNCENYADYTSITAEQLTDGTLLDKLNSGKKDYYKTWISGEDNMPVLRFVLDVDKTDLSELIAKAQEIIDSDNFYLPESVDNMKQEMDNAQKIVDKQDATAEEITAAYEKLETAIFNVIPAILGDVNFDNVLDINDVTLIQKHIVNIEIQGTFYESLADVDGDGIITIKDATSVQIILIKSQAA